MRTMFANAHLLALQLREKGMVEDALRSLVASITLRADAMEIILKPEDLGIASEANWFCALPLPKRRPFREARLRIDSHSSAAQASSDLLGLIADVLAAQQFVIASPELSLAQLAKREGRCRKQLTKLVRLSWLSPNVIDSIVDGKAPSRLTRKPLLDVDLPLSWSDQEKLLGFTD